MVVPSVTAASSVISDVGDVCNQSRERAGLDQAHIATTQAARPRPSHRERSAFHENTFRTETKSKEETTQRLVLIQRNLQVGCGRAARVRQSDRRESEMWVDLKTRSHTHGRYNEAVSLRVFNIVNLWFYWIWRLITLQTGSCEISF